MPGLGSPCLLLRSPERRAAPARARWPREVGPREEICGREGGRGGSGKLGLFDSTSGSRKSSRSAGLSATGGAVRFPPAAAGPQSSSSLLARQRARTPDLRRVPRRSAWSACLAWSPQTSPCCRRSCAGCRCSPPCYRLCRRRSSRRSR